jgi:hypothetical protein
LHNRIFFTTFASDKYTIILLENNHKNTYVL